MHILMYVHNTLTFITEVLCFVTYVQLFIVTTKVKITVYTACKLTLIRLVSTTRFNVKATPINSID